jgi:hypothetical protein
MSNSNWPIHWDPTSGWCVSVAAGAVVTPLNISPDHLATDPHQPTDAAAAVGDNAVLVGNGRTFPTGAREVTDGAELAAVARELLISDIIVASPNMTWALLVSEAEFGIAVGDRRAVEAIAGSSVEDAVEAFAEYVAEWDSPPPYLVALRDFAWLDIASSAGEVEIRVDPRRAEIELV